MNDRILDTMDSSKASYFELRQGDSTCELWQLSETEYAELGAQDLIKESTGKSMDIMHTYLMNFFNFNYKDMEKLDMRVNVDSKVLAVAFDCNATNAEHDVAVCFGADPWDDSDRDNTDQFFKEHKLVLECENVQFTKIGCVHWEAEYEDGNHQTDGFYMIGKATVTTAEAEGDLSGSTIVPAVGESRDLKVKLYGEIGSLDMPFSDYVFIYSMELTPM